MINKHWSDVAVALYIHNLRPPVPDAPTLRGIGLKADFSTANPTSAYDTTNFGKVCIV